MSLPQALADVERNLIRDALQEASGNRSKAAKILGITRPKFYRRMAALFTPEQLAAMAVDSPKAAAGTRQELHWVGPDRNVYAVTSQPSRVWCLPGDQSRAYALPFAPIHGFNAWSLDVGHDWAMRGPKRCLRYSPGGGDHKGAWLLCEWEEKTEKSK